MTPVEKSERERDGQFWKFCPVTITDAAKAPKTAERMRIMRNAWNQAWDLAFEAGRSAGEPEIGPHEIHNRFCGEDGKMCQVCQLKREAGPIADKGDARE